MRNKTTAEIIKDAALVESKNRNRIVEGKYVSEWQSEISGVGTSQNIFTPGRVYIYVVSMHEKPISLAEFVQLKPEIRATRGQYTIQYLPNGSPKRNPKFPYLIGQDLVRIRVTVSGPRHWGALCDRIPELGWLKRNSTLSDEMFAIAKKHPGLVLRFGIDFVKYCRKIEARAEELGVDIDHKPLVVYQWSAEGCPKVDGVLNPVKEKKDYLDVLEEVNSTVTEEEE